MLTLKPTLRRIKKSTDTEPKNSVLAIIKLQEEVGELAAEIIKKEGYTYKEFKQQDLLDEISDVLIQTFSLYFMLRKEGTIPANFSDLRKSLNKKIDKWEKNVPIIKEKLTSIGK